MRLTGLATLLGCATAVFGHAYIYRIKVDNELHPGFDIGLDSRNDAERVAYGSSGNTFPVQDITSSDMACNNDPTPPALIAEGRAGSNITFYWSPWVPSHKGPITAYIAPYTGDVSKANLNELKFIKIAEDGLDEDGKTWATDDLIAQNNTWTAHIPSDLKPGTYVLRHELLALHFATENSNYKNITGGTVGPQFYIWCFNLNITGTGTATPEGVTFPGAYKPDELGLNFDIFVGNTEYPIPGPPLYEAQAPAEPLEQKPQVVHSPTGDPETDEQYYTAQLQELERQGEVTSFFNSIGG